MNDENHSKHDTRPKGANRQRPSDAAGAEESSVDNAVAGVTDVEETDNTVTFQLSARRRTILRNRRPPTGCASHPNA